MDTTFINGRRVGASSWAENPRVYFAGTLKPGRNVIAIRVFNLKSNGGFINPAADLRLVLGDGSAIPLAGEWKGKVAVDARPVWPKYSRDGTEFMTDVPHAREQMGSSVGVRHRAGQSETPASK
jgi:hypothetical protein